MHYGIVATAAAMAPPPTSDYEVLNNNDLVSELDRPLDDKDGGVSHAHTNTTSANICILELPRIQPCFKAPLKPPRWGEINHFSPPTRYSVSGSIGDKTVIFNSMVSVFCIPDRFSYDAPEDLWMGCREISKMVQRNRLEFAADGCDWRNATEEQDMLLTLQPSTPCTTEGTVDFSALSNCGSSTILRPIPATTRPIYATIGPIHTKIHPIHANPLLAAALRRRIPYPKAQSLTASVLLETLLTMASSPTTTRKAQP
jgi:hypothetical protein